MLSPSRFIAPFFVAIMATSAHAAACPDVGPQHDHLAELLRRADACPRDVHELLGLLASDGLTVRSTMVGNRGFHNGAAGSFSFFEAATGTSRATGTTLGESDLLFGHFTARDGNTLVLDQTPSRGALMVELIAWDAPKGLFNFYELIGDGTQGGWHYRGDSADILADNELLHRALPTPTTPRFGTRLRCSGCHATGGPVMKEIAAPHNDWWRTSRPLPLDGATPDAGVAAALARLQDASKLAQTVDTGLSQLVTSPAYRAVLDQRSLQEKVRPLFCAVEVNFASDAAPLDGPETVVRVPTAFLATGQNAGGAAARLTVPKSAYLAALRHLDARFPEIDRADGDHAFLAPVKSAADTRAVLALIADGTVDAAFVAQIQAVDALNPVFSPTRCALLQKVPATLQAGWQAALLAQIPASASVINAERTLASCQDRIAADPAGTTLTLVRLLAQRRAEIAASQISQNPRGQILEPGFRVIFPRVTPAPTPNALQLTEDCAL